MKILITGVAGFIGFSIAQHLLKKKNIRFLELIILTLIIQYH